MTDEQFKRLTDAQRDCLRLILRHFRIKEIAYTLHCSVSTVNQRLERARGILGVSSSLAAALIVAEHEGWPEMCIPAARYENTLPPQSATPPSEAETNGIGIEDADLPDQNGGALHHRVRPMSGEAIIKWPFSSAGRPDNDLTAIARMV